MAKILMTALSIVYVNSDPVGQGQINKRDDVLLIKYLLKRAIEIIPLDHRFFKFIDDSAIWTPDSAQALMDYQDAKSRQRGNIIISPSGSVSRALGVDGVVSPPKGIINRFGFTYTILDLNFDCKDIVGDFVFGNLYRDSAFPIELKKSLGL
ncbi:hypothetical protein K9U39_10495 [Rhodoblastus acidophilus]|uniref:Uncharacterized protein n=1 Tax=Candidatus Rhodoblastus alkanivorans TaxID=2954117 RepID=A0ABS9Z8X5_9HYPH|nr:hypothetical protein [Candidatus Rhodoblastus alkanivorans]MCI4679331.1 hypothetical protein [Candidatus Rhodoblastus alkanivorans]MCI4684042.1 hypothetical protein [Candidatus Rhodoblastus alkanivorans]MDI4641361.1 hypothetical protein [Rhodoblastus acidophilus]